MSLTEAEAEAEEIAALLNRRNELTVRYTRERVLNQMDDYLCRYGNSGHVIACIQVKTVQWYQCEVLHLTVAKEDEGQGHARVLLLEAERAARLRNARLLQCTIRQDNIRMRIPDQVDR